MIKKLNISHPKPDRRRFIIGSSSLALTTLAGCSTNTPLIKLPPKLSLKKSYEQMYGPMPSERFPIPAVKLDKVPSKYYRHQVKYITSEPAGTVVVDTRNFYLYLVQNDGLAMRYGVGLGREGFAWSGRARIGWKQSWPKWTPPDEMIARKPELEKYSAKNGGMPPGLSNPLGARALYIFQGNKDTLYRIHGSPEYWSIGKAVSSGCVRMINQDIIDLYDRVPTKSNIIVI